MASNGYILSLREATKKALEMAGPSIFASPQRYLSFVLDMADGDSPEMKVLLAGLDNDVLEIIRPAVANPSRQSLVRAARRAQDHLVRVSMMQEEPSRLAMEDVCWGIGDWRGIDMPINDAASSVPKGTGAHSAQRRGVTNVASGAGSAGASQPGAGMVGVATGQSAGTPVHSVNPMGSTSGQVVGGTSAWGSLSTSQGGSLGTSQGSLTGTMRGTSQGSSQWQGNTGGTSGGSVRPGGSHIGRSVFIGIIAAVAVVAAIFAVVLPKQSPVTTEDETPVVDDTLTDGITVSTEAKGNDTDGNAVWILRYANETDTTVDLMLSADFLNSADSVVDEDEGLTKYGLAPGEHTLVSWKTDRSDVVSLVPRIGAAASTHTSLESILTCSLEPYDSNGLIASITNKGSVPVRNLGVVAYANDGGSYCYVPAEMTENGGTLEPGQSVELTLSVPSYWIESGMEFDYYFWGIA